MADRATVEVYEASAAAYGERRRPYDLARAEGFAGEVPAGAVRLDLGCGPGLYTAALGDPVVAADAALAMVLEARRRAPAALPVQLDVEALPLRAGSVAGVWAWKCLQHLPAPRLPLALAEVHRALPVGGRLHAAVFLPGPGSPERAGVTEVRSGRDDDFPGRLFTGWPPASLELLLEGAGFDVDALDVEGEAVKVRATRGRTLPDLVAPGMRLLVCGLNASLYAADVGVPYGRPGNRLWPALAGAGFGDVVRRPREALARHGIGFTDLVKRATVAAAEVGAEEFRHGLVRLEHLCELVAPAVVAVCGVTGWRSATGDRRATLGWQDRRLGGAPVYVLPNPSGLNAHARVGDITDHLLAALAGPARSGRPGSGRPRSGRPR